MLWLNKNSEDSFAINIGSFIVARDILLADIDTIKFLVKIEKSDLDTEAVVTKGLGSGVTKLAGDTELDASLVIQFSSTDFSSSKLNPSEKFYLGLAIKTATMTDFLEIELDDDELYITTSFFNP